MIVAKTNLYKYVQVADEVHLVVPFVVHSEKSPVRPMLFYSTNYWHHFGCSL